MESQNYPTSSDLFNEMPVVYADFGQRFLAWLIDTVILIIAGVVIGLILPSDSFGAAFGSNIISLVIGWLYYAVQESGTSQATVGKKAIGIKVTSLTDGGRISFGQATGRYFGKILSGIILLIGYFMMLWDDKKQTLHDKLAGTLVLKGKV